MPKINSRAKGKRGELAFSHFLTDAGFTARRGQQHAGGPDSPDVICDSLPEFHFEVKTVEALNIHKAMEQSIRDSANGQIPIVAHKKNRQPWMVTLLATDWIKLIKEQNQ